MQRQDKAIYSFLKNLDFNCQQCSNCCRKDPGIVLLTNEDVYRLAKNLSLSIQSFLKKCCRPICKDDKTYISLIEKSNYDCIFWNNKCLVYADRPLQCRTFPFWPSIVNSGKNWSEEKKRCKGLDCPGTLSHEQRFNLYLAEKRATYMEMPKDLS